MSPNFAILRCKLTLPGRSIDDKQRRPRRRRGPMRGVAEIRDLVAHPRRELELAAVAQLAVELALQHVQYVAAVAPMVGEIARRIFDHPHPEIADVERTPLGLPGLAGMDGRLDLAPVGDGERGGGELHDGDPEAATAVPLLSDAPAVVLIFTLQFLLFSALIFAHASARNVRSPASCL